ncbi:MAG: aminotransferase class I/II-fold pyridoxal phosphate-dependent enzyme, partial [Clostridia bacterium]|nr:aminotransferase class I/II-fold pyridoxal phosphate-dependent enzyme [Clostridia bacterium]
MSYDFDSVIERRGTDSIKWNVGEGELPMWVADMDFKTAPEITEAILYRAEHGVYGYNEVPDIWYDSYIGWWARRHDLTMKKDWLVFCTGVVPAISSAVRKLTTPGENVLIQTPVYNVFFNSILNNGCRVVENPLVFEDGEYRMDLDDLEKKLSDPQTNLMILCNPHNPVGKIWDKKINGVNDNCKVRKMSVREVTDYIAEQKLSDILCLGARTGAMSYVLNELEELYPEKFNKKTVYASISDEDRGCVQPSSSNAIFTTFDGSKGLERPICFIFDYTSDYWNTRLDMPMTDYSILRNIFCVA